LTSTRYWRVFYTRPRAEKKVERRLEASGAEVFLPMRTAIRQWSDRKKEVMVPLFPGYIFAHVDERERLSVLEDEGIVRCISFNGSIAAARDEEISALRAMQNVPGQIEAVAMRSVPKGAEVVVTSGPLTGVRGFVIGHPKMHYLLVEVASVAQAVRVHIPADWVTRRAA
jgi:transcription termination/antitermination protein NusG